MVTPSRETAVVIVTCLLASLASPAAADPPVAAPPPTKTELAAIAASLSDRLKETISVTRADTYDLIGDHYAIKINRARRWRDGLTASFFRQAWKDNRLPILIIIITDPDTDRTSTSDARAYAKRCRLGFAIWLPGEAIEGEPGEPGKVNLNTADADQLQSLPGIGPAKAEAIIKTRTDQPFKTVDDLTRVRGIGAKTLATIREHVTVE